MVTVGLTVIVAVVAPVLQRNETPPDAFSAIEPPTQMAGLTHVMLHVGSGLTVTVVLQVLLHPLPFVTVTV